MAESCESLKTTNEMLNRCNSDIYKNVQEVYGDALDEYKDD
jgi:hypothetical protein